MKHVKVSLDAFEAKLALEIGDGDLCLGIRRAVVLAGLRAEMVSRRLDEIEEGTDRVTIITRQMAALAEELKHLQDNPPRREEIAVQLVALGELYLALSAANNSSDRDL